MDKLKIYLEKAIEVTKKVFKNEYYGSLGIPLPEIRFMNPDEPQYESGSYYINIGTTWQINLNFGKLPSSLNDFETEVKILTRHEIEHFATCPFDIITHLRMLNVITQIYKNNYKHLNLDLKTLVPSLSNQAADIIIDTHNFIRYPEETLRSEIQWIKKGCSDFSKLPSHSKLMFLTKQAVWKKFHEVDLELNETNKDLLSKVDSLAELFVKDGIINKKLFLSKTESYANLFFELFIQDQKDETNDSGENNSDQQSSNNNSNGQQNIPAKDTTPDGSNLIFQSPENIDFAIQQLAQETELAVFEDLLEMAGIKYLNQIEKRIKWFEFQNTDEIEFNEFSYKGSEDLLAYPENWKIGDPIEELDLILTLTTSPIIIPGVTTKKWYKDSQFIGGINKKNMDLLLVLDSSGSMGHISNGNSNLSNAIKSSFGVIKHFEKSNSKIATINFSTKSIVTQWTKEYNSIKKSLFLENGGSTIFPTNEIISLRKKNNEECVIVVITDGDISNPNHAIQIFKDFLRKGDKLFFFLQSKNTQTVNLFKCLEGDGAIVSEAFTADDIREIVLSDL